MALTISKALSSNKPPPPDPKPSPELFPTTKLLPDGRKIWLSVPQPDHLTIMVSLSPTVYGNGVPATTPVADFADGLGSYFKEEPFNAHWAGGNVWWNAEQKKWLWKEATLRMGGREALVYFALLKSVKDGPRLRIELNPRKLGVKGFSQLGSVLGGASAPFDLSRLIDEAWVTRVDAAIDVVGVRICEVARRQHG